MTNQQGAPEALDDLYLKLHGLSKRLEGSGRIDEYDAPEAYPAILDAMNLVRRLQCEQSAALVEAQQPAPSAAAPCPTCNDQGAVGNILTAEPCPDCTPQADSQPAPIDMVLHCPKCGMQHIDVAEVGPKVGSHHCTRASPDGCEECDAAEEAHREWLSEGPWLNPPHRSHLCHGCGHIWRPADVPTNGVKSVKTTGKADSVTAPAGGVLAGPIYRIRTKNTKHVVWTTVPKHEYLAALEAPEIFECELISTPPAQAADSVLEDAADPLQGAANWLAEAHGQFCVAVLQGCLMIGYNRAKRLHDVAIAARKQGANHEQR